MCLNSSSSIVPMIIHPEYKKVTSRDPFSTQTCVVLYQLLEVRSNGHKLVSC